MRPLLLAVGLLTRVPVPVGQGAPGELRFSAAFFPLVGALLGVPLLGLASAVALQVHLRAALALALLALLSGALHLDGLADVADGLGGGRGDRARTLEIMRDPRIGAHGAAALVLVLLVQVLALGEAIVRFGPAAAFLLPIVGRAAVVPPLALLGSARAGGLGQSFGGGGLWPVAIALASLGGAVAWAGVVFVPAAAIGMATAFALSLWLSSRLGGMTGDVCGAAVEIAQACFLVALVAGA